MQLHGDVVIVEMPLVFGHQRTLPARKITLTSILLDSLGELPYSPKKVRKENRHHCSLAGTHGVKDCSVTTLKASR
jgi:hypothetical protein